MRERPPALGAPAALTVPAVRSARLPNGIQLRIVEQRELPLVQVIVSSPAARASTAPPGDRRLHRQHARRGRRDPRRCHPLRAELAFLGARLQTGADWDRLFVALKVPVRSLGPALDLLADVVRRPTFSAAEVRRQRDLRLATLLQQRDQPNALADLAFNALVYLRRAPYHNSAGGDSASVAAFDSVAVRNFYTRAMRPERASAVIVLATWMRATPAPSSPAAWVSGPPPVPPPRRQPRHRRRALGRARASTWSTSFHDAAQSVITIGWPGVDRLSPTTPRPWS
ncbi:MAG: insulinase family protein [Gemmatimonadetes bacterium]|nr:insulinase family protein [Gemmatimonadota bacterium]